MSSINKIEIPLIKANNQNLEGYGYLVDDFKKCKIEIVTWPKQGWRDIEKGTGNEGGITEGPFETWWDKGILYGRNNAVAHKSEYDKDGKYLLGYSSDPNNLNKRSVDEYLFIIGSEKDIKWLDKYTKIEDLKNAYIREKFIIYKYKGYTIYK